MQQMSDEEFTSPSQRVDDVDSKFVVHGRMSPAKSNSAHRRRFLRRTHILFLENKIILMWQRFPSSSYKQQKSVQQQQQRSRRMNEWVERSWSWMKQKQQYFLGVKTSALPMTALRLGEAQAIFRVKNFKHLFSLRERERGLTFLRRAPNSSLSNSATLQEWKHKHLHWHFSRSHSAQQPTTHRKCILCSFENYFLLTVFSFSTWCRRRCNARHICIGNEKKKRLKKSSKIYNTLERRKPEKNTVGILNENWLQSTFQFVSKIFRRFVALA